MDQKKPQLPDGEYAINEADKVEIRELGKKLLAFFEAELKDRDSVHMKILVGSFEYVMAVQQQKRELIGNDFIFAEKATQHLKLSDKIEEPFPARETSGAAPICIVKEKLADGNPGKELGRFEVPGQPGTPESQKATSAEVDAILARAGVTKENSVVMFGSPETVAQMDAKNSDPDVDDASVTPGAAAPIESPIQREDLDKPEEGVA